jgi:molybdopterin synthase catalytic subunit/molybdopterin converting factor small subunit
MQVKILAFATASDHLGRQPIVRELPAGADLGMLEVALLAEFPGLAALWPRLAVAVDGKLVPAAGRAATPLRDGAEVALLPPVSGGAPGTVRSGLVDGPLDAAAAQALVAANDCGALVLFLGNVRDHHAGRQVTQLTYSAYAPMAADRLAAIVADLEEGDQRVRAAIFHRLGDVPVGEPSVVIAVASPHRQAAYEASRLALERLKREVPIWKREHYADGAAAWREEEPLDQ